MSEQLQTWDDFPEDLVPKPPSKDDIDARVRLRRAGWQPHKKFGDEFLTKPGSGRNGRARFSVFIPRT